MTAHAAPRRPAYLVGVPGPDADSQFWALLAAHLQAEQVAHAEATERLTHLLNTLRRRTQEAAQQTDAPADEYVTVKEAAARLGVCVETIRAHLKRGLLPGVAAEGVWRVNMAALRAGGER